MIQLYVYTRHNLDSMIHTLDSNTQKTIKSKRWEKIYHVNNNQKLCGVIMWMSDNINFNTKLLVEANKNTL